MVFNGFCYVSLVACSTHFGYPKHPKWHQVTSKGQSRSSQGHSKCSLEAPKVTPNTSIWSHCAQSEPNLNPEAPKIHQKTPKMLPKCSRKVTKGIFSRQSRPQLSFPAPISTHPHHPHHIPTPPQSQVPNAELQYVYSWGVLECGITHPGKTLQI